VTWYLSGSRRFQAGLTRPAEGSPGNVRLRYDLAEGQGVVVEYSPQAEFVEVPANSGRYLPASFMCSVVLHELPYMVTMTVGILPGHAPALLSLGVSRRQGISVGDEEEIREYPALPSIKAEALREIPVGRLFALAKLAATHSAPGPDGAPDFLAREDEIAQTYRSAARSPMVPRNSSNNTPLDDDHYRQVASVYLAAEAAGDYPTLAVKEEWGVSTPTAARYVRGARDRRFLGEVERSGGKEK
jgi:hypothetical protein